MLYHLAHAAQLKLRLQARGSGEAFARDLQSLYWKCHRWILNGITNRDCGGRQNTRATYFDSQQHLSYALFVNLHTNCPFLTEQQQDFTSLPVSLQIIFLAEAANPVGTVRRAAANKPRMACFIFGSITKSNLHSNYASDNS